MRSVAAAMLFLASLITLPAVALAKPIQLEIAEADVDPHWFGAIRVRLTPESRARFAALTDAHRGDQAVIRVDGEIITRISIFVRVEGDRLQLMGLKTNEAETQTLASRLHRSAASFTVAFEPRPRGSGGSPDHRSR